MARAIKVNAGAGSGKTFTMTYLVWAIVTKMLEERTAIDVKDALSRIFITSFTNAGVREITERIYSALSYLNASKDDIQAYTFDSAYYNWVCSNYQMLGFPAVPKLITAEFQCEYVEDLLKTQKLSGVDYSSMKYNKENGDSRSALIDLTAKAFEIIQTYHLDGKADAFDRLKEKLAEEGYMNKMTDTTVTELLALYKEYDDRLREENLVTFSHMQGLMDQILAIEPDFIKDLGYEYIIVDEFQDTNEYQISTIKEFMRGDNFKKLIVVGDDNQAIFSFRDATPEYIINLEKYLGEEVENLYLDENRRSTPEIIEPANKIIELNQDRVIKSLIATRPSGKKVSVKGFHDSRAMHYAGKLSEREDIAAQITKMVKEDGISPNDIAVIGRNGAEVYAIGSLLSEAGIPWVSRIPMNLLENSKVQAALALSDAFYDPEVTQNYFTYLCAKYDGKIFDMDPTEVNFEIAKLKSAFLEIDTYEFEDQQKYFHGLLNDLAKAEEDEIYEYFLELLYANESLPEELRYTRVFKKYGDKMKKKMDQAYEGVTIVTAHSSKGLEWPIVFLTLSSWDKPRYHSLRSKKAAMEVEEERRVLFVAMTRARDELYISSEYVADGNEKEGYTYNQFFKEIHDVMGFKFDPTDYDKIARRAEKERLALEAKLKRRKKQDQLAEFYDPAKARKKKKGEMSDEEKLKYLDLVKGAKQSSIEDFLKTS